MRLAALEARLAELNHEAILVTPTHVLAKRDDGSYTTWAWFYRDGRAILEHGHYDMTERTGVVDAVGRGFGWSPAASRMRR